MVYAFFDLHVIDLLNQITFADEAHYMTRIIYSMGQRLAPLTLDYYPKNVLNRNTHGGLRR